MLFVRRACIILTKNGMLSLAVYCGRKVYMNALLYIAANWNQSEFKCSVLKQGKLEIALEMHNYIKLKRT